MMSDDARESIDKLFADIGRIAQGTEPRTMSIDFDDLDTFISMVDGNEETHEFGSIMLRLTAIQVMLWAIGGWAFGCGATQAHRLLDRVADAQGRMLAQELAKKMNTDGRMN